MRREIGLSGLGVCQGLMDEPWPQCKAALHTGGLWWGAVHLTGRLVSALAPQDTGLLAQEVVTLLGEGAVASRAADGRPSHGCDR